MRSTGESASSVPGIRVAIVALRTHNVQLCTFNLNMPFIFICPGKGRGTDRSSTYWLASLLSQSFLQFFARKAFYCA